MQGNFQNKHQIVEIKIYQDIQQQNYYSNSDMLNLETFLLPPYQNFNNESEAIQIQQIAGEKTVQEKQDINSSLDEKVQKDIKQKSSISPHTRLSNYIFPNILRQVKQCLSNSFQGQDKNLHILIASIFRQFKINYQIWAFDAILVILIYLRDKTDFLTHKKFSAVIDHISSTLSRYLAKFIQKPFTKEQIKYLSNQYNYCIQHLKVYDDPQHTFDILKQKKNIKEEFFQSVLLTRRRQSFKFIEQVNIVERSLSTGYLFELIDKCNLDKKLIKKDKEKRKPV